ncbi:hypothetical protein A9Q84_01740 [Halobacteriovorax marinus]|uniref:Xaa-Pro dipeptidyl-peptidase C-terminal domain-containing protein n=1 Tax=Halobacteriovorax marinus TaxID=97084 RepID=A0A1Y5FHW0_9BACT|nr:hypothetical protein A9Q84_01740 [Halobacteriovorax marinus]
MKDLSKIICLLSVLTFVGCSKKEKDFEYTKVVSELELLRMQQMQRSSQLPQGDFATNRNGLPIAKEINPVVDGFCQMISDKNIENPFEVDKYFATEITKKDYAKYIETIQGLEDQCISSEVLLDKFPLLFVKYQLKSGKKLYGTYRVGENKKITSFYPFFNEGFEFDHKLIEMSDGKKISTTILSNHNGPTKTIFLKTPYFHTDLTSYYIWDAMNWVKNGYSFVIQSNRGSHASTGDFKWLHEKNIQDSKETIDWIAKQQFNNGEVTAYGTSYDGYNALAAAVGKPEALKSVIACSAPANAQTDSFTAGETIESWLIEYIAKRENSKPTSRFQEKMEYLNLHKDIGFDEYDNYLYGRDIADWQDLMDARKTGDLKSYWQSRSMLEGLSKVTIPVFHIAGVLDDQDSRDTILTHRYILENAQDSSNHRLYLHRYGHGCGNFLQEQIGTDFLNGDLDLMKQEYRDSAQGDSLIADLDESISEKTISLNVTTAQTGGAESEESVTINNRFELMGDKTALLSYEALEDMQINGVPEIELKVKSSLVKSNLSIYLIHLKDGNAQSPHNLTWGSSRSSFVLNEELEGIQTIKLTLPPMAFKVAKGDSIQIYVTTDVNDFLDIFMMNRAEYYTSDESAGYLEIMKGEGNTMLLPLEKIEEADAEEVVTEEVVDEDEDLEKPVLNI